MLRRLELRCLNCDHERYWASGEPVVCRKCRQAKTLDDFLVMNAEDIDPVPGSQALYGA